jgi:hypothetical protein
MRFGHNLDGLCDRPAASFDLVVLGGRVGLGVALGAGFALVGLLAWLFA